MDTTSTRNTTQVAAAIHLSTFAKYIFPMANFILPIILWQVNNDKKLIDHHGKQAIIFQLSMLIYSIAIGVICIPFFVIFATDFVSLMEAIDHGMDRAKFSEVSNLTGYILLFAVAVLMLIGLFIFELYAVITASMRASKGEYYKYPLCIPFLSTDNPEVNLTDKTPDTDTDTEEPISENK